MQKPLRQQQPAVASGSTGQDDPASRLAARLKDDMTAVNGEILTRMQSDVALIPQLASHLIAAGGKRLRPLLTLASARLFDYTGERHYKLAACVEFIHTATLLHDDVVDESSLRRGRASANALFGNEAAVLVGDFLFSRSFQLMTEDGDLEVLRILSNAAAVIAEGEVMQLTTANNIETSIEEYFQVIAAKTAALFSAACEVGALIAGRPLPEREAIRDYGHHLGVAFQISDDALDYGGASSETIGKALGDDFKEGKMTLPVILALQETEKGSPEWDFWHRVMTTPEQQTEDDFAHAQEILLRHNALERTLKFADKRASEGAGLLKTLPDTDIRHDLSGLIRQAARRKK